MDDHCKPKEARKGQRKTKDRFLNPNTNNKTTDFLPSVSLLLQQEEGYPCISYSNLSSHIAFSLAEYMAVKLFNLHHLKNFCLIA